jgi:hypothetical protein
MGPFLGAQTNLGLEQREGEKRTLMNQVCGAPGRRPRARVGGALLLLLLLYYNYYYYYYNVVNGPVKVLS